MKERDGHTTVSIGALPPVRSMSMVVRFSFEGRLDVMDRTFHLVEHERHGDRVYQKSELPNDSC